MNKNTTIVKLEKIYLLNVLLYVNETESMRNFIEINKKCREVGCMMRLYTPKKSFERDENNQFKHPKPFIQRDIYKLFSKVETIECTMNDLIDAKKQTILNKAKIIRLSIDQSFNASEFPEKAKKLFEKVHQVRINTQNKLFQKQPLKTLFPQLKKVQLIDPQSISPYLGSDRDLRIEEVTIKYSYSIFEENKRQIIEILKTIDHYRFIDAKRLIIWKVDEKSMKELVERYTHILFQDEREINCKEYYDQKTKTINLNDMICSLMKKYSMNEFELYKYIRKFNMKDCRNLEKIEGSLSHAVEMKIKGIQTLKEIVCVNKFDTFDTTKIPKTVTKLTVSNLYPSQNVNKFLIDNPNIKELTIHRDKNYHKENEIPTNFVMGTGYIKQILPRNEVELQKLTVNFDLQKSQQKDDISELFVLQNYTNIQELEININCYECFPRVEDMSRLNTVFSKKVNLNVFVPVEGRTGTIEFKEINELPYDCKRLNISSEFDARLIHNDFFKQRMETVYCIGKERPKNQSIIDLSGFDHCKKLHVLYPYGYILFPKYVEDIFIEMHGNSGDFNFTSISTMKRIYIKNPHTTSNTRYSFSLPTKMDFVMIEGPNIIINNINEIKIKKLIRKKEVKRERNHLWMDAEMISLRNPINNPIPIGNIQIGQLGRNNQQPIIPQFVRNLPNVVPMNPQRIQPNIPLNPQIAQHLGQVQMNNNINANQPIIQMIRPLPIQNHMNNIINANQQNHLPRNQMN